MEVCLIGGSWEVAASGGQCRECGGSGEENVRACTLWPVGHIPSFGKEWFLYFFQWL